MSKREIDILTERDRRVMQMLVEDSIGSVSSIERISTDTIFSVLEDPGNRYVLTYLLKSEGFVSMSELVDYVLQETDHSMTDRAFRRKVTKTLTTSHLPDLEEQGFVQYNIERQIVQPTDRALLVAPYLELALLQQNAIESTISESRD